MSVEVATYPVDFRSSLIAAKRLILLTPHYFFIGFCFVLVAAKVKHAVNYGSHQFLLKRLFEGNGVFFYPVDADKNFTFYFIFVRIIKCDDVGIKIVVQKLSVNVQQVIIRTKNVRNISGFFVFFFQDFFNPIPNFSFVSEREIDIFNPECDS
jgi:hypothetical protein